MMFAITPDENGSGASLHATTTHFKYREALYGINRRHPGGTTDHRTSTGVWLSGRARDRLYPVRRTLLGNAARTGRHEGIGRAGRDDCAGVAGFFGRDRRLRCL